MEVDNLNIILLLHTYDILVPDVSIFVFIIVYNTPWPRILICMSPDAGYRLVW